MNSPAALKSTGNRQAYLEELSTQGRTWDIIVIGGGASGLGIALEAVSRGYKVLLVERSDFAKGTSSRSTKLVHGGVRYLAQGNIALVREAGIERGRLQRNAPHLVKDQVFLVPVYTWWSRLKYTTGLKLYDLITGGPRTSRSRFISRKETMTRLPELITKGLKGSVLYHDGQFDDSRLAINLAQTIRSHGGNLISYMEVTTLLKGTDGQTNGLVAKDAETGIRYTFAGSVLVNATGVFVDEVLAMDNEHHHRSVRVSQGIHLVIYRSHFSSADALMIPETSDGRVLFAVPWHDKVVVGTTDTPMEHASTEPIALDSEVDFILANLSAYIKRPVSRKDVLSVFAGLRPLAAPAQGGTKTREISRSHRITITPSGIFTMLGGKWTTYRRMGEDMVDRIEKEKAWKHRPSRTASLPIHGSEENRSSGFNGLNYYGCDKIFIEERIAASSTKWISEPYFIHEAMIRWSVQFEMARTVEDFLARRCRLLFLDAKEAQRIAPAVAAVMAEVLVKDDEWIRKQVSSFEELADNYMLAAG